MVPMRYSPGHCSGTAQAAPAQSRSSRPVHRRMRRSRVKLYWFSEMPHHVFEDGEDLKYPAMRLEMPNTYFDRDIAATNYHNYFDEHVLADDVGFDGLMINEHHST